MSYAEMMLDGTCCSCCGEFLGDGDGFAMMCPSCSDDNEDFEVKGFVSYFKEADKANREKRESEVLKVNCPFCKKRVKDLGLHNHIKDSHKGLRTRLVFQCNAKARVI